MSSVIVIVTRVDDFDGLSLPRSGGAAGDILMPRCYATRMPKRIATPTTTTTTRTTPGGLGMRAID